MLEKRGELMKTVENDTYKQLASLKKDKNKYKELLKKLMIQGFIRVPREECRSELRCSRDSFAHQRPTSLRPESVIVTGLVGRDCETETRDLIDCKNLTESLQV